MIKGMINTILEEIGMVLTPLKEEEMNDLSSVIRGAKRVFVYGEGRSGLMSKAFAMRLMHGGFTVYVVGETITPSIEASDLLVVVSGSGETDSIFQFAKKAKEIGTRIALLTTNKQSKIAGLADHLVTIPAATKYRRPEEPTTIQPLGNQFDQAVHIVLDALVMLVLQKEDNQSASTHEMMKKRHANLE